MKTYTLLLILVFLTTSVLINTITAEKILVVGFISTKSHKMTYMPLIEELAKRGHEITIVSPIPATKQVKNIKEIFTFDMEKEKEMQQNQMNLFEMKENNTQVNPFMMLDIFTKACKMTYDLPQVKALLKEKFDLIFFQPMFNDCALGFIHRLKAPLVLFAPTSVPSFLVGKIGGHMPPSFVSNIFLGYSDEMSFYERFINFGVSVLLEGLLRFSYEPAMTAVYREKLGQDLPTVREILGNASLILSNGHFSLSRPKPLLPDVVDVGGIHSRPAKPLPKDLEDFVSGGKDGFILFSMGSAIKMEQMKEDKRKMFLNVFSKLKQRVLWKWESETMADLPGNVKLSKWLPQQDLLGHPNIKTFITHCGGGGTEEAIYHGVPLVGLPMFGDQPLNAKLAKNHGFLIDLDWNELTEEKLLNAINEILNNPKYSENVKKLSKVFKDQPDDPMQRGVFWVEYVMRHKGAPHLRSAARKLNYLQYHSWDIIAAYLLIISIILRIVFAILRFIGRKCCGSFKKSTDVSKSKKNK